MSLQLEDIKKNFVPAQIASLLNSDQAASSIDRMTLQRGLCRSENFRCVVKITSSSHLSLKTWRDILYGSRNVLKARLLILMPQLSLHNNIIMMIMLFLYFIRNMLN